jgi:thiol:disulfide interchange protein DsbD
MNSVKVVGGLLEIAAAFKFLNTAEVSFRGGKASEAFFDAQLVLALWVVTALVCGIYLLGLFRTDHDHDAVRVGPLRLVLGTLMLGLALYLAPALFGAPPRSPLYEQIAGIFPQDSLQEFDASERLRRQMVADIDGIFSSRLGSADPAALAARGGSPATDSEGPAVEVKPTSTDPRQAAREKKEIVGDLAWGFSYEAALEEAKAKNKPVLIDFTGVNCPNCRTMEAAVIPKPQVTAELRKFVRVRLYTDFVPLESLDRDTTEMLGEDNYVFEQELVGQSTSPLYVVVSPDGTVLAQKGFDTDVAAFVSFLKDGLARHEAAPARVAAQ